MKVRSIVDGSVLEVVDGEPLNAGEISRYEAQPYLARGDFEEVLETRPVPALLTIESPVSNIRKGKRRG